MKINMSTLIIETRIKLPLKRQVSFILLNSNQDKINKYPKKIQDQILFLLFDQHNPCVNNSLRSYVDKLSFSKIKILLHENMSSTL